jgi:uncharacterized protein YgiB involved in biofilm formation
MKANYFVAVALLTVTIAVTGCKRKEQCAPGDAPAVCKAVQECFASGTGTEVCREGERDANKLQKSQAPAYNGTADALTHDSSKAPEKAVPKQPEQQPKP